MDLNGERKEKEWMSAAVNRNFKKSLTEAGLWHCEATLQSFDTVVSIRADIKPNGRERAPRSLRGVTDSEWEGGICGIPPLQTCPAGFWVIKIPPLLTYPLRSHSFFAASDMLAHVHPLDLASFHPQSHTLSLCLTYLFAAEHNAFYP